MSSATLAGSGLGRRHGAVLTIALVGAAVVVLVWAAGTPAHAGAATRRALLAPGVVGGATGAAPTSTTPTSNTLAPTPTIPAPATTPPPFNGLPAPVTLPPLVIKQQSTHISPLIPALSGIGLFVALVIMTIQVILTRPGRRGPTL